VIEKIHASVSLRAFEENRRMGHADLRDLPRLSSKKFRFDHAVGKVGYMERATVRVSRLPAQSEVEDGT
jgi:hypothetical protein